MQECEDGVGGMPMSENEFQIPDLERRKNNNLSKNKITIKLKRVFF